jgi:hypothetical protein
MRRQIVGVCREHCPDLFADSGFEKPLGNQGDDPVTHIAPRQGRLRKQANRCRQGDGHRSLAQPQESQENAGQLVWIRIRRAIAELQAAPVGKPN